PSRGVISVEDERSDLRTPRLAGGLVRSADDERYFGGHHVAIGVHGNEKAPPLESEPDSASRWRRTGGAAQTHRLAFQVEKLLRLDLAPFTLERLKKATFDRRELFDFLGQRARIGEHFPCSLEREGDGRRSRSTQVVRCDRADRFEGSLREQRADT